MLYSSEGLISAYGLVPSVFGCRDILLIAGVESRSPDIKKEEIEDVHDVEAIGDISFLTSTSSKSSISSL